MGFDYLQGPSRVFRLTVSVAFLSLPSGDCVSFSLMLYEEQKTNVLTETSITGLVFATVVFCLLTTFPTWHEEEDEYGEVIDVKPFPPNTIVNTALMTMLFSVLLIFVSILWQHTAAVTAAVAGQNMAYGSVKYEVGAIAVALGWAGFILLVFVFLGLILSAMSLHALSEIER